MESQFNFNSNDDTTKSESSHSTTPLSPNEENLEASLSLISGVLSTSSADPNILARINEMTDDVVQLTKEFTKIDEDLEDIEWEQKQIAQDQAKIRADQAKIRAKQEQLHREFQADISYWNAIFKEYELKREQEQKEEERILREVQKQLDEVDQLLKALEKAPLHHANVRDNTIKLQQPSKKNEDFFSKESIQINPVKQEKEEQHIFQEAGEQSIQIHSVIFLLLCYLLECIKKLFKRPMNSCEQPNNDFILTRDDGKQLACQ